MGNVRVLYLHFPSTIDGFCHHSGIRKECPVVCTTVALSFGSKYTYLRTSSSIIEDIQRQREAGLAILTYFYVDFKDTAKQDFRNLLSSLLIQLGAQSDRFCDILSTLYSEHDRGLRQPRDDVLTQCLKNMFELPGQGPLYVIVDALDECPNSSGMPTPREQVLDVLEQFADLHLQHLRLCVTSRPEVDIQTVLDPLTAHIVSIHDEGGQNQDIMNYIRSVVLSDSKMRRWREEDRKLVIDTLTQKAGGMYALIVNSVVALAHAIAQVPMGCMPTGNIASLLPSNSPTYIR